MCRGDEEKDLKDSKKDAGVQAMDTVQAEAEVESKVGNASAWADVAANSESSRKCKRRR